MLIPVIYLKRIWKVVPKGVLHVGAHEAEELEAYQRYGWTPIIWVEAQPNKIKLLQKKLVDSENYLIQAAIWDKSGEKLMLNITNNSESTSLFELKTHLSRHPEVAVDQRIEVVTSRLDDLALPIKVDYLSLDIQGGELRALMGFNSGLVSIKWIYTEVNREELYRGCALVGDIDAYLATYGFKREFTIWTKYGWGDALYVRAGVISTHTKLLAKVIIPILQIRSRYFNLKHSIKTYFSANFLS